MSLTAFLQQYPTGIPPRGAHALVAIGCTLVHGILRLINSAHGDVFMMTGYFTIFAMASLPWFIVVPVTLLVTIVLSVSIECVTYRPLRSVSRMSIIVSAIGVSYLLQNLATYLLTAPPKGCPGILSLKRVYQIGGLSASLVTFPTPVLTLILMYLLIVLINHTKIGMAMRVVSKDYETTSLMGIKVNKTISFTSAIGPLLAGIGSIPYFTDRVIVFPFSGALPGLGCSVAAVFGEIRSIPGAVIGGLILGLGEVALAAMGQSTLSDAFTFILLIVMSFIRPIGLFGEKTTDRV